MVAIMYNNIGSDWREEGNSDQALVEFGKARQIAEELGDKDFVIPLVLSNIAVLWIDKGEKWDDAQNNLIEARTCMLRSGYKPNWFVALETLGRLLAKRGEWVESEKIILDYIEASEKENNEFEMAFAYLLWAEWALLYLESLKEPDWFVDDAVDIIAHFDKFYESFNDAPYKQADYCSFKAEGALWQHDYKLAEKWIEKAFERYALGRGEHQVIGPKIHEINARVLNALGHWEKSHASFKISCNKQKDSFLRAHANFYYALALHEHDEIERACARMRRALTTFEKLPVEWLSYKARHYLEIGSIGKSKPLSIELSEVRQLLKSSCDDPGLDALLLDHFPDIYDKTTRGMQRDEKINLLLNYCRKDITKMRVLLTQLDIDISGEPDKDVH
jgi:tetratricopeptide (TPR) repeat protein